MKILMRQLCFRLLLIALLLVAQFGQASMTRIDKSVRSYLNEEAGAVPDPRQRSTFLHFPDIPASP